MFSNTLFSKHSTFLRSKAVNVPIRSNPRNNRNSICRLQRQPRGVTNDENTERAIITKAKRGIQNNAATRSRCKSSIRS